MKWAKGHPACNIYRDHGICVLGVGDHFFFEAFPHCCEGCLKFSNPRFRSLWVARCQRLRPRAESIFHTIAYCAFYLDTWYLTKIRCWLLFACRLRFWRRLKFMKVKMHQLLDLRFIFLVATRCPWMSMSVHGMISSVSHGYLRLKRGAFRWAADGGTTCDASTRWKKQCVLRNGLYMVCLRNGLYTNDLIRNGFLTPRVLGMEWNVIIPTDFHSMIFNRGIGFNQYTTKQL